MEKRLIEKTATHKLWILPFILFALYLIRERVLLMNESNLDRAHRILKKHLLVDTHNDLPSIILNGNNGKISDLDLYHLPGETDITRMHAGGLNVQFWSAYAPCKPDMIRGKEILTAMEQIDLIKRMVSSYPDVFAFATNFDEIKSAHASGKIASLIGMEGGHQILDSLAVLRNYYHLGVRYLTLTHVCHTNWADSCALEPYHDGLTDFGRKVVLEMNRLGMMVDISHVSHKTMRDVIEITSAPLFFSHSSVYSLCKTGRNVPDDVLLEMKRLDGVIMINFWPELISCTNTSTLEQVADHIDYVVNLIGVEHVGFGSDFDGATTSIGLEDVSKYPMLLAELFKRGYSEKDVIAVMGGNLVRILKKTEDASNSISTDETRLARNYTC